MYKDEEILKMTPQTHPAIKMAEKWGGSISDEEYNIKLKELTKWALEKTQVISEKYGKEASNTFLKIVAPHEIKPFLKAGFELNYEHIDNLIDTCITSKGFDFLEQDLARKLVPIRESVTTLALNANALWGAKQEFKGNPIDYKKNLATIVKYTTESLALLAQGEMGHIQYLDKFTEEMQKDAKSDNPPTATFIKALKTIKHQVNESVYEEKHEGFINTPENN